MTHVRTAETNAAKQGGYVLRLRSGESLFLGGSTRTLVMGILNVTPDSFSDGGLFLDIGAAVAHAEEMAGEGADLIDIGGESTRPGSVPVPVEEQLKRVIPVVSRLANRVKIPISIDTTSATVARSALDGGAQIVNDISALRDDPFMTQLIVKMSVPIVLMHRLGMPKDMQRNPHYDDVVTEVLQFLQSQVTYAQQSGIAWEKIIVDPGFGFGKRIEHNLELLRRLSEFKMLHRPILVGTSRKAMIGQVLNVTPQQRVFGTAATIAAAVERGAAIVRVHDVKPAVHVVKIMSAILGRE